MSSNISERVVITGIGCVSPNGSNAVAVWESLVKGISPIKIIPRFAEGPIKYKSHLGAEIVDFSTVPFLTSKEVKIMSRFTQFAIVAAKQALMDAHFVIDDQNSKYTGVMIGTGIGGIEFTEQQQTTFIENGTSKLNPFAASAISPHAASAEVSIHLKLKGPQASIVTGCSAGLNAIGQAYDAIRLGRAEVMLTGGSEAPLSPLTFGTFDVSRQLSVSNDQPLNASRPFDLNRDGFILSEGAAVFVLERLEHAQKRGAHIYAEIAGTASTGDAYHSYQLDPTGESVAEAMQRALFEAEMSLGDIDLIAAHGSGSKGGDEKEAAAILKVFKDYAKKIPVTAIKSNMGMPFGASGPFQLLASTLAIERKVIPPTLNYENYDEKCPLNIVSKSAREGSINTVLMNSFGLGGNNATLIIKKFK